MTISGSCLCGAVQYKINSALSSLGHCHCKMCQRFHGTAYATYGMVAKAQFSILRGRDHLKTVQSSVNVKRHFCSRCGSPLTYQNDIIPDNIWITAGTFDDDPGCEPQYHIFVASKAPWFEINDNIPQFDGFPEE